MQELQDKCDSLSFNDQGKELVSYQVSEIINEDFFKNTIINPRLQEPTSQLKKTKRCKKIFIPLLF